MSNSLQTFMATGWICASQSASQIVSSFFSSDGLSYHLSVIAELNSDVHRRTCKEHNIQKNK